jgi:23S rRNA pseudouridine1911/1915/1917 synthase
VVLVKRLPGCSRAYIASLIKQGCIRVGDFRPKPSYRVRTDETVTITFPPLKSPDIASEEIPLNILFEDDHVLVIDKPPGLVVHPSPGHSSGTLVHGLLHHCKALAGIQGVLRPGIVHRLDKDTSGVLVVAKTSLSHEELTKQFRLRMVKKKYLALVWGCMKQPCGVIDAPIGRHPVDRKKMATVTKKGRDAETLWRVLTQFDRYALIEVEIKTGRTHQIRVHCAHMGHPVLGDPVYGGRKPRSANLFTKPISRQMLHAWELQFFHPLNGNAMRFVAPMPGDMAALVKHALPISDDKRPLPWT